MITAAVLDRRGNNPRPDAGHMPPWRAGRLPVEELRTSVGPLSDRTALLDPLADGSAIRQIVHP